MPTKRPRVTVVMPVEMYGVLCGMKEVTGQSVSSLVVELLEVSVPSLQRLVDAFRPIKAAQLADRERISAALLQAQEDLQPLVQQAFSTWDSVHEVIEGAVGAAMAPPGAALARQPEPARASAAPATNRGGTKRGGQERGLRSTEPVGGEEDSLKGCSLKGAGNAA